MGSGATLERQESGLMFNECFGGYFYASCGVVETDVVGLLPCARRVMDSSNRLSACLRGVIRGVEPPWLSGVVRGVDTDTPTRLPVREQATLNQLKALFIRLFIKQTFTLMAISSKLNASTYLARHQKSPKAYRFQQAALSPLKASAV